ncbi:MAG: TIGR03618 family F420-dependent PPOX class oxidoreductase [Chloroflexota bacterium]|nr:TIGR03618 family F420-dependent PPOX class oxidoreductase [Chloroflexota bacterium]MDE2885280.1 TIGR03618 family F420-dependent PPOX class oxidoreductase [Chloroflexota bacterium]
MANLDDLDGLLAHNNVVVFTTFRRDGMPQQSLVTVGKMDGGLAFTTRSRNAKAYNLARDPRCAIMLVRPDNRGFAVLDGSAEVQGPHNTDADALRLRLREVYRVAAGKEHPDWDEYDRVMLEEGRVTVLLRPDRIFARNV